MDVLYFVVAYKVLVLFEEHFEITQITFQMFNWHMQLILTETSIKYVGVLG